MIFDFRDDFLYGDEYDPIWKYINKYDNKLSDTLRKLANRIEEDF